MDLDKVKEQFNQIAEKYDDSRKCFVTCFCGEIIDTNNSLETD